MTAVCPPDPPRSADDVQLANGYQFSSAVIGVQKRAYVSTEDKAIRRALLMARGVTQPLPVIHGKKLLGVAQGLSVYSDVTRFIPYRHAYRFGWTTYDALINDITVNGKIYTNFWAKSASGTLVALNWYDMWCLAGNPGAGSISNTATTATKYDDTTTGSLYHGGNVSTDIKRLLSIWTMSHAQSPSFMLVDRVLGYDQCTHTNTATTTMTNTNTAQRYNGASLPGLSISMVSGPTLQGATVTNLTSLIYVNQGGTAGQTMPTTATVVVVPSAAAGTTAVAARMIAPSTSGATVTWGPFLPLAQGDTGARSITSYVTSSARTGNMTFTMVHPLAYTCNPVLGIGHEVDQVMQNPSLERLYDGACIQAFAFALATTTFTPFGNIRVGWGA